MWTLFEVVFLLGISLETSFGITGGYEHTFSAEGFGLLDEETLRQLPVYEGGSVFPDPFEDPQYGPPAPDANSFPDIPEADLFSNYSDLKKLASYLQELDIIPDSKTLSINKREAARITVGKSGMINNDQHNILYSVASEEFAGKEKHSIPVSIKEEKLDSRKNGTFSDNNTTERISKLETRRNQQSPDSEPTSLHDEWFLSTTAKEDQVGAIQDFTFTGVSAPKLGFPAGFVGPLSYTKINHTTAVVNRFKYGVMITSTHFAVLPGLAKPYGGNSWAQPHFTRLIKDINKSMAEKVKFLLGATEKSEELLGLVGVIRNEFLHLWSAGGVPFAIYQKRGQELMELRGSSSEPTSYPIRKGDVIIIVSSSLSAKAVRECTTSNVLEKIGEALINKLKHQYPRADIVVTIIG